MTTTERRLTVAQAIVNLERQRQREPEEQSAAELQSLVWFAHSVLEARSLADQ
jgi:hypothetical protein